MPSSTSEGANDCARRVITLPSDISSGVDQLVISLQKLIEAKDAAVRTALANHEEEA